MTDTTIALAVVVALFSSAQLIYTKFVRREGRLRRAILRHPRVPIAAASSGVVHVAGIVRAAGQIVRAPATGRSCVAFQLVVAAPQRGSYVRVLVASDARSFVLTDDSGEAIVDLTAGPFTLIGDQGGTRWCSAKADSPEMSLLCELLDLAEIPTKTPMGFSKSLRYREVVLLEDDHVSIKGHGEREVVVEGQRASYRDPPTRFVMRGAPDEPLIIGRRADAANPAAD
jgi:hypothetical protein